MTGYVYILKCSDNSYYTGSTKNIEARLWQHQNGQGANHTRKHLPVELVFVEQFERIDDAFAREKQIQGWSRKKKEALMVGDFNRLHELAKCRNTTSSAGFDSAQPTVCKIDMGSSSEVECGSLSRPQGGALSKVEGCALSEVEGRSLSEAEGCSPTETEDRSSTEVKGRSLSGVEGGALSGVEGKGGE